MHALLTLDDWDLPRSCITEEKGIRASRRVIRSQFCGASRLSQETLTPRCPRVQLYTLILPRERCYQSPAEQFSIR
jgi:hypothetical protein